MIIFWGLGVLGIAFNWITILISIVFTVVGLVLIIIELTRMPMYKRLPNYFACIADSKNGSLDAISASLGYPYETVVSDIEFLINRGILEKTYINHSRRLITSPLIGEVILQDARRVLCPNCGATNEIIGQTKECDFVERYCSETIVVISLFMNHNYISENFVATVITTLQMNFGNPINI